MSDEILLADINVCELVNKAVDCLPGKRFVTHPRIPLGDSLDFDGDRMKAQIEQGYADAQTFLGP